MGKTVWEQEMERLSEDTAKKLQMEEYKNTDVFGGGNSAGPVNYGAEWTRNLQDLDWIRAQEEQLAIYEAVASKQPRKANLKGKRRERPRQPDPQRQGAARQGASAGKGKKKATATGVDCAACMDAITGPIHRLTCEHTYCTECLRHLFKSSLAGETGSFPPKCCGKDISQVFAKHVLSTADYGKCRERMLERKADLQFFCPSQRCSARLEKRNIKGETGTCPRCFTKVCTRCKGEEHRGVCKENELSDLAKKEGWRACPKCGRMVDKNPGTCNHVACPCGQHFCYKCGRGNPGHYENAANGGCDCPIWNVGEVTQALVDDPYNGEWAGAMQAADLDQPFLVNFANAGLYGRDDLRPHFEGGHAAFRAAVTEARRHVGHLAPPMHVAGAGVGLRYAGANPWGPLPGGIVHPLLHFGSFGGVNFGGPAGAGPYQPSHPQEPEFPPRPQIPFQMPWDDYQDDSDDEW